MDVSTSTMHDWQTGKRITTLRYSDGAVRITEQVDGAPTCSIIQHTPRYHCTPIRLPHPMTFDEAVTYHTLRLAGHPAPLEALRASATA